MDKKNLAYPRTTNNKKKRLRTLIHAYPPHCAYPWKVQKGYVPLLVRAWTFSSGACSADRACKHWNPWHLSCHMWKLSEQLWATGRNHWQSGDDWRSCWQKRPADERHPEWVLHKTLQQRACVNELGVKEVERAFLSAFVPVRAMRVTTIPSFGKRNGS